MKIGIVTMYFGNRNYGGNLQAYALCCVLNDMGHKAEIVSFYNKNKVRFILSSTKQFFLSFRNGVSKKIRVRNKAIKSFNISIPHTKLFFPETIKKANKHFDCFIVGSDQVWNPDWLDEYTTLNFADNDKVKISYAASLGKINLSDKQRAILKQAIDNTNYISLREKENISLVKELTDKPIKWVLDPTLLLDKDHWDMIVSDRLINCEYMFCYFLRGDRPIIDVAVSYAKSRNLKIVTFPYLNGCLEDGDANFGDYRLYNVSPKDFISLIKYASFIMTDSFHATVFAHIYKKEFIVLSKNGNEMGCRMSSLTEIFGTENRYLNDYRLLTFEYLQSLDSLPYKVDCEKYLKLKEESLSFLKGALLNDR